MASTQNTNRGSIRTHLFAGATAAGFGALAVGGWAAMMELAGAVIAPGVVVVDSNVKKVQHPMGGIVKELLVQNSDVVKAGQVLVRLDDTLARSTLQIHIKRNDELMARQARLEAELAGAERIVFPPELTKRRAHPGVTLLLAGEEQHFSLRRKVREGEKAQLRQRISQLGQEIVGLEAQATAKESQIELVREELEGVSSLWQKNLIQFKRMTALQRDLAEARGDSGRLVALIATRNNEIAEAQMQILQIDEDLRSEVGEQLAAVRADLAICTERKIAAEDVFFRIEIRAPQDGIVHNLSIHTVGGVIAEGRANADRAHERDS